MTRILKLVPIFLALTMSSAFAGGEAMDAEIDFLLESVASSSCTFIRNGKEHGASDARDHLQMKRRRGKRYFDSTEEFIERLASESSWTGKPYRIRCGDEEVNAKSWFTSRLTVYRRQSEN